MSLRRQALVVTTDGVGAGTATTPQPINGYVIGLRNNSAAWGGTADYTFTAPVEEGGGTVIALTDQAGPFSVYTGGSIHGSGPSAAFLGVPVDGHLAVRVAQAEASTAGTIHVYHRS